MFVEVNVILIDQYLLHINYIQCSVFLIMLTILVMCPHSYIFSNASPSIQCYKLAYSRINSVFNASMKLYLSNHMEFVQNFFNG